MSELEDDVEGRIVAEYWARNISASEFLIMKHNLLTDPSNKSNPYWFGALVDARKRLGAAEQRFIEHTKAVGEFLAEMYATMIDPLAEGETKVAEMCSLLLTTAREQREQLNAYPVNAYPANAYPVNAYPANWLTDSSLETWFPLTAEEMVRLRAERDRLKEQLAAEQARDTISIPLAVRATREALDAHDAKVRYEALEAALRVVRCCVDDGHSHWTSIVNAIQVLLIDGGRG